MASEKTSKDITVYTTCDWCETVLTNFSAVYLVGITNEGSEWDSKPYFLCQGCKITALNAIELGREVTQLIPKGGRQLYIAIERTGQENALLSAKRWSPLESLESVDSAESSLVTYPIPS